MTKQAERFGAEFKFGEVVKVELNQQPLRLHTRDEVIETRTLIIATGILPFFLNDDLIYRRCAPKKVRNPIRDSILD